MIRREVRASTQQRPLSQPPSARANRPQGTRWETPQARLSAGPSGRKRPLWGAGPGYLQDFQTVPRLVLSGAPVTEPPRCAGAFFCISAGADVGLRSGAAI